MKLEIIIIIFAIGVLNHLFFDKELTIKHGFKKIIIPIVCAICICLILSLFTNNIYITTLPVWLLLLNWCIRGYISYYRLIKQIINNKQKK